MWINRWKTCTSTKNHFMWSNYLFSNLLEYICKLCIKKVIYNPFSDIVPRNLKAARVSSKDDDNKLKPKGVK